MRNFLYSMFIVGLLAILAACGNNDTTDADTPEEEEELHELLVEFEPPKTTDVDETIELKAVVTYGDENVTDAEVVFEYWEQGNEDDTTKMDAVNNEDGTYTAEVDFDHDAVFEIYAHTDAKDLHTMPKRAVAVGDAEKNENNSSADKVDGSTKQGHREHHDENRHHREDGHHHNN